MSELNRKLAIWAGFTEADVKKHYYWEREGRKAKWLTPGTSFIYVPLPNFDQSLDLCFKWLIPKAQGSIVFQDSRPYWHVILGGNPLFEADGLSPALALCWAIAKVIEREAK